MDANEKLALQQQLGGIVLFKEGLFLRAYNESCYILTKILGYDLRVQIKPLKKNEKKWTFMCGFPLSSVKARLPDVKFTDFGAWYNLSNVSLDGYEQWFNDHYRYANEVSKAMFARSVAANAATKRATKKSKASSSKPTKILLSLNQKQADYLLNWQKNRYSLEVEQAFIASLKEKLS